MCSSRAWRLCETIGFGPPRACRAQGFFISPGDGLAGVHKNRGTLFPVLSVLVLRNPKIPHTRHATLILGRLDGHDGVPPKSRNRASRAVASRKSFPINQSVPRTARVARFSPLPQCPVVRPHLLPTNRQAPCTPEIPNEPSPISGHSIPTKQTTPNSCGPSAIPPPAPPFRQSPVRSPATL
jgi:hypothetical protein